MRLSDIPPLCGFREGEVPAKRAEGSWGIAFATRLMTPPSAYDADTSRARHPRRGEEDS